MEKLNLRQTNGLFHQFFIINNLFHKYNKQKGTYELYEHYTGPFTKTVLTKDNAEQFGYKDPTEHANEYGIWLLEENIHLDEINNNYSSIIRDMVKDVPDEEVKSWPEQREEAFLFKANNNTPTPYIDGLVINRKDENLNIDFDTYKAILVDKIIEKVNQYKSIHSYYTGIRQRKEDRLKFILTNNREVLTHLDVFEVDVNFEPYLS